MNRYLRAYEAHKDDAHAAFKLFQDYCGRELPRVPGMDTVIRLATRLACGRCVEEAAAREYLYRWNLALIPSARNAGVFGVPHTLGM